MGVCLKFSSIYLGLAISCYTIQNKTINRCSNPELIRIEEKIKKIINEFRGQTKNSN